MREIKSNVVSCSLEHTTQHYENHFPDNRKMVGSHEVAEYTNTGCSPVDERSSAIKP